MSLWSLLTRRKVMAWNIPCSFIFLNKDIFFYFGSFLVDSGYFQLTSTISTTFLLVKLVVIKHGHHIVSCLHRQPQGVCFSCSWRSLKGCAMPPTLFEVSKITRRGRWGKAGYLRNEVTYCLHDRQDLQSNVFHG